MDQSTFEYTSCNVLYKKDGVAKPFLQNQEPVPAYSIREFSNITGERVKVGFIGVVLPFNQASYVEYLPVTETFRKTYKALQKEVDVILGITHLEIDQDIQLAKDVPGIPLYLGGHDHTQMNHYVENTIITKADANAKTIYIHRITYNPASKMTRIRSSLKVIDDSIPDDPDTRQVVRKWQDKVNSIMMKEGYDPEKAILQTSVPLECTESKVRTRPTNFGAFTAKAFESVLPGADLYLLNSGSMRLDDQLLGTVTEYDVLRTYPFGGSIVSMQLPGKEIKKLLDIGLVENVGLGGYLQGIYAKSVDGSWELKGRKIKDAKRYKVVLPEFVAKGLEANLGFLSAYQFEKQDNFQISRDFIKNDIRDIVIFYMKRVKVFNG